MKDKELNQIIAMVIHKLLKKDGWKDDDYSYKKHLAWVEYYNLLFKGYENKR